MLVDYSEGRSLVEAAEMTFDGEHPCALCIAITESREKEREDPALPPERRADRHELFPQEEVRPKHRRTILSASSPPSPTELLRACRFVPELPTPPPRTT